MKNDFASLTREAGKIKAKYPEGTRIELEQILMMNWRQIIRMRKNVTRKMLHL